jgi:two-component system chemotaxis response regulator CheY
VKRTLRQAGFGQHDTLEACDGKQGLAAIRQDNPDLVLSDWNMPEMTGIELLKAVREEGIDVRFGFVTTEGSEAMRSRATEEGAEFLIVKPFTPDHFKVALTPFLG